MTQPSLKLLDLAVVEGLEVASGVVVLEDALEAGGARALAVGGLALSLAVGDLEAGDLLAVELLFAVGGDTGLATGVVAGGLLALRLVEGKLDAAAVAELGVDSLEHLALGVHGRGVASTPASGVPVVHVPRETVVGTVSRVVAAPHAVGVSRAKADLVAGGEAEGPVGDAVPVGTVDAVSSGEGTVATVTGVVAAGENAAGRGESTHVVVVAEVTDVLGSDEHPEVVGVPVVDDVAHVAGVLLAVHLTEAGGPAVAGDHGFLDVVVDADLGLLGGVADVLTFASAEGLVVALVAIVQRAVGVEALAGGLARFVTGMTVGHVVHVAGFTDFGGHLFGAHGGEEAKGELHG